MACDLSAMGSARSVWLLLVLLSEGGAVNVGALRPAHQRRTGSVCMGPKKIAYGDKARMDRAPLPCAAPMRRSHALRSVRP